MGIVRDVTDLHDREGEAPAPDGDAVPALDTVDEAIVEVFEEPMRWRVEVIRAMGLAGDELVEAASPSPAFPQLLWFVARAVEAAPAGTVVDLGGGLGGLAHALHDRTGRPAVSLEASWACCDEARRLFPGLPTVRASASRLPLAPASVGVAVMSGVASLLDDVGPALAEARRVLVPGGRFVLLDLVAGGPRDQASGPNRFRAVETLEAELRAHGLDVDERAVASVESGRWGDVADAVNREVIRRHRGDPGFERWLDDHRHVARVLASGRVLMAGLAAVSRPR